MEPRILRTDAKGTGDSIVFVPGSLTGWLSWVPHQEAIADSYRAIRVQPIGNELGSAGQPGDPSYSYLTERESLAMTLDSLSIDSCHFAGWSGGARAMLEFSMQYGDRVRSLTLVEPAAFWILEKLGIEDPIVEKLNAFLHPLAGRDVTEDDLATFLEYAAFIAPGEDARQHPNWQRWLPHRNGLSWQGEFLDTPDRSPDELKDIQVPTLLVRGTNTAEWLKKVADEVAARLPHVTALELEGDHACHIQRLDDFMESFRKHLSAA
ncbi:MAG: alpha/beta fold hydrolase [Actinomycetota bacterium]|nr:alpha/beta hydrolase [Actinomycetota bacterium]